MESEDKVTDREETAQNQQQINPESPQNMTHFNILSPDHTADGVINDSLKVVPTDHKGSVLEQRETDEHLIEAKEVKIIPRMNTIDDNNSLLSDSQTMLIGNRGLKENQVRPTQVSPSGENQIESSSKNVMLNVQNVDISQRHGLKTLKAFSDIIVDVNSSQVDLLTQGLIDLRNQKSSSNDVQMVKLKFQNISKNSGDLQKNFSLDSGKLGDAIKPELLKVGKQMSFMSMKYMSSAVEKRQQAVGNYKDKITNIESEPASSPRKAMNPEHKNMMLKKCTAKDRIDDYSDDEKKKMGSEHDSDWEDSDSDPDLGSKDDIDPESTQKIMLPKKITKRDSSIQKKQFGSHMIKLQKNFSSRVSDGSKQVGAPAFKKMRTVKSPKKIQKTRFHNQGDTDNLLIKSLPQADDFNSLDDDETINSSTDQIFLEYKDQFRQMTKRSRVETYFDVISITISHDEKRAIAIIQVIQSKHYVINQYNLKTDEPIQNYTEIIGTHVKIHEVSQNEDGNLFVIPYFYEGKFKMVTFDQEHDEIDHLEDINTDIGINHDSTPAFNNNKPMIVVTFCYKKIVCIDLYENNNTTNWHFFYDIETKKMIGEAQKYNIGNKTINFQNYPINIFYDMHKKEIYVFYRLGQCLTLDCTHLDNVFNIGGQDSINDTIHSRKRTKRIIQEGEGDVNMQMIHAKGFERVNYSHERKIVIAKSCTHVIFFKLQPEGNDDVFRDINDVRLVWKPYFDLHHSGQMQYLCKKNLVIFTQKSHIFQYKLNTKTLVPELDRVMFNFMSCSHLIYGKSQKFCITYQKGSEDFVIYKRNVHHNFKVKLDTNSKAGCTVANLDKHGMFCLGEDTCLKFYDQEYNIKQHIEILKEQHKINENDISIDEVHRNLDWKAQQILNIKVSQKGNIIACIIGQQLGMGTYEIEQLSIISITDIKKPEVIKQITLPDALRGISTQFEFTKTNESTLWLIDEFMIYQYDFMDDSLILQKGFKYQLQIVPTIFVFNAEQDKVFIAAQDDVLIVDINNNQEIDIDKNLEISQIKACLSTNKKFYVLANKCSMQKGLYLLEIDEKNIYPPDDYEENNYLNKNQKKPPHKTRKFIVKWWNQLDLGDASLFIQESGTDRNSDPQKSVIDDQDQSQNTIMQLLKNKVRNKMTKELVICYKAIWINTYNVCVVSLNNRPCQHNSSARLNNNFIFRFETFHLWEHEVYGKLLNNDDFLILSSEGMSTLSLNRQNKMNTYTDKDGNPRMLHSLQKGNYLKTDETNLLVFQYTNNDEDIVIRIQEQYSGNRDQETLFNDVYKVIIKKMYLPDLILFQGLFSSTNRLDIAKLIEQQPHPYIFYNSYLELDMGNLISILSFDSRSIEALLNENHASNFNHEYPIFFRLNTTRTKIGLYSNNTVQMRTAIDIALENKQYVAVEKMIDYIVKYQNNFAYFFIFHSNFIDLLNIGINVTGLLNSKIFCYELDFDHWPQTLMTTHKNSFAKLEQIKPFNDSIFHLRNYPSVFKDEKDFEAVRTHAKDSKRMVQRKNVYRVKYTLNLLPSVERADKIMDIIGVTKEHFEIFDTQVIKGMIDYKWNTFAYKLHYLTFFFHLIYFITFVAYVNYVYCYLETENKYIMIYIMFVCHMYNCGYECRQVCRQGTNYFEQTWNYIDMINIINGLASFYLQYFVDINYQEHAFIDEFAKSLMLLQALLLLFKTFQILRMFTLLTKLVILISTVVNQLIPFLVFWLIVILVFSVIFGIIGVGNIARSEQLQELQRTDPDNVPNLEYEKLGQPLIINFLTVFRYSFGDFGDFPAAKYLETFDLWLFWIFWVLICLVSCVIFLNFVIAEVTSTYQSIISSVEQKILKQKAQLIDESEDVMIMWKQSQDLWFPKFMVMRSINK